MKPKHRIALGAVLTGIGCAGIVLGPVYHLTDLAGPWSFVVGFLTGLSAGLGVALSIAGMISNRKE